MNAVENPMHTCPSCQAQMLEFLYDLLDDAERQAMQDHLDGCAACRAELDKAREQQNLLAAAARMEFSGVQFTAPTEAAPAVTPMPAKKKVRPWRRCAAAAAVLLAVGGLAVPGWWAQVRLRRGRPHRRRAEADRRKADRKAEGDRRNPDGPRRYAEGARGMRPGGR